jgi:hypothetical protein
VALIRTDVSEDRIASIFRVNECEQVQSETVSSCTGGDSTRVEKYSRVAAYTRAYCFALYLLALVHPEDGGDTTLRNVGSYKSHTASSPRR